MVVPSQSTGKVGDSVCRFHCMFQTLCLCWGWSEFCLCGQLHQTSFCYSMCCFITDNGAPPTEDVYINTGDYIPIPPPFSLKRPACKPEEFREEGQPVRLAFFVHRIAKIAAESPTISRSALPLRYQAIHRSTVHRQSAMV